MTLKDAITKYAPPGQNNTASYLQQIEKKTGFSSSVEMRTLTDDQISQIANAIPSQEGNSIGTETTYPAGSIQASQYLKTRTIDPVWAQAQPPGTLTLDDITALNRLPNAKMNAGIKATIAAWYAAQHPGVQATDATGRPIPPVPQPKPAPPTTTPGQPDKTSQNDNGDDDAPLSDLVGRGPGTQATPLPNPPAGSGGGTVNVRAYSRGAKNGPVAVSSYTRSAPARQSAGGTK